MLTERQRTAKLIKPILRGRDIKRYRYEWAGLWLINTHNGYESSTCHSERSEETQTIPCHSERSEESLNSTCHSEVGKATEESLNSNRDSSFRASHSTQNDKAGVKARNDKIKIPPIDIETYPALKAYLNAFYEKLEKRADKGITPYNLRNCAYLLDFEKEKIVWAEMTKESCFVWDNSGIFINQTCYFIPNANKYILACLNSKLIYFYMQQIASNLGDGAFRWIKQYVEKLPIPKITNKNSKIAQNIVNLVDKILALKNTCHSNPTFCHCDPKRSEEALNPKRDISPTAQYDKVEAKILNDEVSELEKEIDNLVYKLYKLNDDEIKLISKT